MKDQPLEHPTGHRTSHVWRRPWLNPFAGPAGSPPPRGAYGHEPRYPDYYQPPSPYQQQHGYGQQGTATCVCGTCASDSSVL
jgi:hypothetical protein